MLAAGGALAASGVVSTSAAATEPAGRSAAQTVVNAPPPPPAATARYRITIDIAFDASTHPGTAPPNPHVSPPVIATHRGSGVMFGAFATRGVEAMAELGQTVPLVAELRANPDVADVQVTTGVAGIGTRTVLVDLTHSADSLSLVTMLAPSPDWFIGFADLDLLGYGGWVPSVTFALGNYDAGTDSGAQFTSPNADTQPRQPISGPRDAAFVAAAGQNPFGTVTITRIG